MDKWGDTWISKFETWKNKYEKKYDNIIHNDEVNCGLRGNHNNKSYCPKPGSFKFVYEPGLHEIPNDDVGFSGGNKYSEVQDPLTKKFLNNLQGNIRISHDVLNEMKKNSGKIFELMS